LNNNNNNNKNNNMKSICNPFIRVFKVFDF